MSGRRVLIAGAGVAGPSLAWWLLHHGFEPVLVERAPALRTGGYIIDFWGLGFDVADKMGLIPALRGCGYPIEEARFVDDKGRRIGAITVRAIRDLVDGRYISLLRSDLSACLYAAIDGRAPTTFGDSIAAIAEDKDGVLVEFQHGRTQRFDLVIGADGLHSGVRRRMFGEENRFERYLGYCAASFAAEDYPAGDPTAYESYAVPGRQVSRYVLRNGRSAFLFVFAQDEKPQLHPNDRAGQESLLRQAFADVGWECPQMLQRLGAADDLYFDSVSQIHLSAWSKGRTALEGDAAYCPSLLAGEGSGLAMAGAYILAGELAVAAGDHAAAFAAYERRYRGFIERKLKTARRFAGAFTPKTAAGLFVRDQVIRLMDLSLVSRLSLKGLIDDRLSLPDYDGAPRR
jgi:2-polyprenyl-6-methoxyphenol hydroxylase-like FAD-dependent oxidoreductase